VNNKCFPRYNYFILDTFHPETLYINIQMVPHRKHITSSAAKINRIILFTVKKPIYFENRAQHTNTLCGQNAEIYYVKAGGMYTTTGL
jgi:hypothetical protein